MPYKLLVVDDDAELRQELADFLEDYDVVGAAAGAEALDILRRPHDIDLVILDVMMPGLRGTEVLRRIKKEDPEMPVVILTAYSSKNVAVEALKGNADDYMEKPVDIPRAQEIISGLLADRRAKGDLDTGGIEGKIERVRHFLEINYHKKVSLKDAADIVCLSPKYLSRLFKERTGTNFNQYRLGIKAEKAKEMLRTTGANVDQIAYRLGYRNPESFIRIFKRITGLTPTEYRSGSGGDRA
jgi:YesN/AraC family two-component response regulator